MKLKQSILAFGMALLSLTASAYTTTVSESLKVWYDNPEFEPDGTSVSYITVYENDVVNYSAFNMYFVLPEGLRVNQIKQGRETVDDIKLSGRAASTHSIACNIVDGTMLKIFCDSSNNDDFYPDDEDGNPLDELFTVGLIASEDMKPGTYEIYLTDILFVLADGNACVPSNDPIYGTLTVLGENPDTGIESVDLSSDDNTPYFNLQGIEVNPEVNRGEILIHNGKKIIVK